MLKVVSFEAVLREFWNKKGLRQKHGPKIKPQICVQKAFLEKLLKKNREHQAKEPTNA